MEPLLDMSPAVDEQAEFDRLIDLYTEHLKFMNRSLMTPESFLEELANVCFSALQAIILI